MLFWLSALNSKTDKITEHSSSLIDNIFSNCSNLAQRSHIIYDDISDHLPTLLITDLNEYNNQAAAMQPLTTRDFREKIMMFFPSIKRNNMELPAYSSGNSERH